MAKLKTTKVTTVQKVSIEVKAIDLITKKAVDVWVNGRGKLTEKRYSNVLFIAPSADKYAPDVQPSTTFSNCKFMGETLSWKHIRECTFIDCDFTEANMENTEFLWCSFVGATL